MHLKLMLKQLVIPSSFMTMFRAQPAQTMDNYEKREPTICPLSYQPIIKTDDVLYPPSEPVTNAYLRVSPLHELWYAEYGNRQGIPVVVVHGGPGGGCSLDLMRFFDPAAYRIILFDQRGAMRSKPLAEMNENTTQDLIADMEKLREHLKIDKWMLFGGSWGTLLSMVYGEEHPDRCLGFVLRGTFLGTDEQNKQLWLGMGDHYPEAFDKFQSFLPFEEQKDLINSYHTRIQSSDKTIQLAAARSFVDYDNACFSALTIRAPLSDEECISIAVAFSHYSQNRFFIEEGQILKHLSKITHLPAILVHGRFDTVSRLSTAFTLFKNWPGSQLKIVPDAGHWGMELGIVSALVEATNDMKGILERF